MSGRARGFAPWLPKQATLALLAQVKQVLAEYAEHSPLTVRQVFYRLVATCDYSKSERAYKTLGETLNRARRAGMIPFDAIRDDGTVHRRPNAYDGTEDFLCVVRAAAERFRLNRQTGQERRLLIAVEAAGMVPQIVRIAHEYGVEVMSGGGFDSSTQKHAMACDLANGVPAEVLHIGDFDPSGVHIFKSLAEDVSAFVAGLGGPAPRFTRLAVTRGQIAALNLPTAPPKKTDRRSFDGETVQLEAIPPDVLADIVRTAIEERQDRSIFAATLADEAAQRAELLQRLGPMV
jgi:hypothetical protein